MVQALHAYAAGARNQREESGQAETAFEEFHDLIVVRSLYPRIDQDLKSHRPPFAQGQLLGGNFLMVFLAVFDYGDLERQTNLWRRQTDAGRPAHGLAHVFNELLYLFAADFLRRKSARRLAQNRFSCVDDG